MVGVYPSRLCISHWDLAWIIYELSCPPSMIGMVGMAWCSGRYHDMT